ncbi:MAG: peptidoglycan recognition family protein [Isosphaeraceae bacterium]|nr:peptidoglycan recognition family protein [Isosphaeraceae bacterium]
MNRLSTIALVSLALAPISASADEPRPGTELVRKGDEIVVCGRLFHIGTPVVLWTDPGGYDAYRVERRFTPLAESGWDQSKTALARPNRFGMRSARLSPEQIERVRGGGWDLPLLQDVVDQFVIHFDVCGTSKRCFQVLHDSRGLSVHFMLDIDGTIYQTLDLKESAWHATIANSRSVGIEIANMGAYPVGGSNPFAAWYQPQGDAAPKLIIPNDPAKTSIRLPELDLRPARPRPVVGEIQGKRLEQYDLTPQQYAALIKLTAALTTIFPKITLDYPRDAAGKPIDRKLPDDQLRAYRGVLGHYHVQTNKVDPGPAFQWDTLIDGARALRGR